MVAAAKKRRAAPKKAKPVVASIDYRLRDFKLRPYISGKWPFVANWRDATGYDLAKTEALIAEIQGEDPTFTDDDAHKLNEYLWRTNMFPPDVPKVEFPEEDGRTYALPLGNWGRWLGSMSQSA